jgi:hypothetical protein
METVNFKSKGGNDLTAALDSDNGTLILGAGNGKVTTKVSLQALELFLSQDEPRACAEAISNLTTSTLQIASLLVNTEQGNLQPGVLPDPEDLARLRYLTQFLTKVEAQ